MEPSSADNGFFQETPVLENQFYDDVTFQRVLKFFVPQDVATNVSPEMAALGDDVIADEVFDWISDAERNLPCVRGQGRDAFGRSNGGELVTSEGWRRLQDFGIQKGMVAFNYDTDLGDLTRVVQMLRIHLWEGSCANVMCPSAMQDGAARLLQLHLSKPPGTQSQVPGSGSASSGNNDDTTLRRVLIDALGRLTSRDPSRAWTSGQWMTERPGGSDVSRSESVAVFLPHYPSSSSSLPSFSPPPPLADPTSNIPLGPWSISGAKFFSSATDAGMTILLARTSASGLSAFYAPTRRQRRRQSHSPETTATELNGIAITRLKSKLGTQSLPTAELQLSDMRAWLLGTEGRGVSELATILSITRVHSAVAAVGYLGRGLGIARAYSRVRRVAAARKGQQPQLLCETPLHVRTLARMTGEYRGLMLLTFFTAYVLGVDERGSGVDGSGATATKALAQRLPPGLAAPLLRSLTSLCKAYVCRATIPLMHSCMEALGGVGYLLNGETERVNVARLFRDACVLPIWEGTTDVLANDFVRALKAPTRNSGGGGGGAVSSLDALGWVVENAEAAGGFGSSKAVPTPPVPSKSTEKSVESRRWENLKAEIEAGTVEDLLPNARELLLQAAEVLVAVLLRADAESDGDAQATAVYERFLVEKGFVVPGEDGKMETGTGRPRQQRQDRDSSFEMDRAIVFGSDSSSSRMTRAARL